MYLDEPQVRAALEDPNHVGHGRAKLELSSSDAAWNPEGEDVIGPATVSYERDGDTVRLTVGHE